MSRHSYVASRLSSPILFAIRVAYIAHGGPRDDMVREPTRGQFDPQAFLAKVGTGKTISVYLKYQVIFSQGEVADTIFYIQKGSVKVVVLSDQGKEAVVGILEAGQFFGDEYGDGRKLDHGDNQVCHGCDAA